MILLALLLANTNTVVPAKSVEAASANTTSIKLTLDSNGTYIYEYPKQRKPPVCSATANDGRPVDVDTRKHFATLMGEPNQVVQLTCRKQ
jgi:hypothetical protein